MQNNSTVVQKVLYPAILNVLDRSVEVIVPDLDIDVSATEIENAISMARYLVQHEIDVLYANCKEIPPPSVLGRSEIMDIYKYGEELIMLEAEIESYL